MKELMLEAKIKNLPLVLEFVEEQLMTAGCSMKAQIQIAVAVEEIFVNIAHYAYHPNTGKVIMRSEIIGDPPYYSITFIDRGVPYNPLAREDPDVTLSAEQRKIGGLGIYMVKKSMDEMIYEFKDGKNILTLKKRI
jgi:anti-sigma regulatory factor (Ser/Thr protein kinase)